MSTTSLDGIRLEWLTSFLAVVDFGGFAAAAENSFRSQPRISTHVAELERQLGAVLFDRRERPVRLTDAGIAFLEHARRVLTSLDAGVSSVQAVLGLLRGGVRLGWYPSAGAAFGPTLLREFRSLHPGVVVNLLEASAPELTTALHDGEVDVVIRPMLPLPKEPGMQHHPLWEEPLVAVLPETHVLADRDYVSVKELAAHPLITIGPGASDSDSAHEVHRVFTQSGLVPSFAYRTNLPQTLVNLSRDGLGIGVTNLLAAAVSETSGMRIVPLRESAHRRQVAVFWNSARPLQPASRALIDLTVQLPAPSAVRHYQRRA